MFGSQKCKYTIVSSNVYVLWVKYLTVLTVMLEKNRVNHCLRYFLFCFLMIYLVSEELNVQVNASTFDNSVR